MRLRENRNLRFVVPIAAENTATVFVGLLFSAVIGKISGSALAASGFVGYFFSCLTALLYCLTLGSGVLTARFIGEGNRQETTRTVEQALFLTITSTMILTALCIAFAVPIVRLLLPSVEEDVFAEVLDYYRLMICSFPLQMLVNVGAYILRAKGDSRICMITVFIQSGVQLACAYLFVNGLGMGIAGAGMAYLAMRLVGAAILISVCLKEKEVFKLSLRGVFHPDGDMHKRFLKLGLPLSVESLGAAIGYLLASSLALNASRIEAGAYQIFNTLYTFPSISQNVSMTALVTLVGQRLGAQKYLEAQKEQRSVRRIALICSMSMTGLIVLLGRVFVPCFTDDSLIAEETYKILWLLIPFVFTAQSINATAPALQTAGDGRFVMISTSIGVWAVKIPLTWLFSSVFHMGNVGLILANVLALAVRMVMCGYRAHQGKWMYLKV